MRRFKYILVFALLAIAAQGAYAQTDLTLYDAADNRLTITDNKGLVRNVTLSGRTLYQDGDWNTLCLPFAMNASQIAASPLADAVIKELDGTNSYLDDNGKLTLKFQDATTIVAGKPYIVKWPVVAINNADDWGTFLDNISMSQSYKGKIVRLNTDITTNETVGTTSDNVFGGIFDGNGHTINCNIDYSQPSLQNQDGVALFRYINNATIMNLKVTGDVKGYNHCAGLVGYALGTNTIKNCEVAATIICYATGDETHCGGILGNGTTSTTMISNCLFSGSLSGSTSTTGIIYGWGETGGTQNIDHCLANANYTYVNSLDIIKGDGTINVEACYKNTGSGNYGMELDVSFGTDESATSPYVADLGASDWEMVTYQEEETTKYKVVPKMTAISTITNPVFNGVTIANTTVDVSFTSGIDTFKGNYAPLTINNNNRDDILLLTTNNELGYAAEDLTLNAFRAYFYIPAYPSSGARVRNVELDFGNEEATGIISLTPESAPKGRGKTDIYDLQGRKVTHPTKGMYIMNGRKIFKQ